MKEKDTGEVTGEEKRVDNGMERGKPLKKFVIEVLERGGKKEEEREE